MIKYHWWLAWDSLSDCDFQEISPWGIPIALNKQLLLLQQFCIGMYETQQTKPVLATADTERQRFCWCPWLKKTSANVLGVFFRLWESKQKKIPTSLLSLFYSVLYLRREIHRESLFLPHTLESLLDSPWDMTLWPYGSSVKLHTSFWSAKMLAKWGGICLQASRTIYPKPCTTW